MKKHSKNYDVKILNGAGVLQYVLKRCEKRVMRKGAFLGTKISVAFVLHIISNVRLERLRLYKPNIRKIEVSGACPEPMLTYKIAPRNRIEATILPIDSFCFEGGRLIFPE